jgi:hypothetical protein
MATNQKTAPAAGIPTTWGGEDALVLDGQDLIEKDSLIGKAFLLTGIRNHLGAGEVLYAQFEATFSEDVENGDRFMFQDSGKGTRTQVNDYFNKVGVALDLMEEWQDCRIVCPKGLRVSDHKQPDERGRMVDVRSFYLTTSGRRQR